MHTSLQHKVRKWVKAVLHERVFWNPYHVVVIDKRTGDHLAAWLSLKTEGYCCRTTLDGPFYMMTKPETRTVIAWRNVVASILYENPYAIILVGKGEGDTEYHTRTPWFTWWYTLCTRHPPPTQIAWDTVIIAEKLFSMIDLTQPHTLGTPTGHVVDALRLLCHAFYSSSRPLFYTDSGPILVSSVPVADVLMEEAINQTCLSLKETRTMRDAKGGHLTVGEWVLIPTPDVVIIHKNREAPQRIDYDRVEEHIRQHIIVGVGERAVM
jgi:hypothetical protein